MADDMLVGTPLFEEEAGSGMVPTKHVDPIWKQEVVDAEGRRRFHGAFTGGFSAGYYNTVGSAEGWAPAEFKSSRSSRNDAKAQTAEDFMDEDDLTSFGGKQLQTNSQYDSLGRLDGAGRARWRGSAWPLRSATCPAVSSRMHLAVRGALLPTSRCRRPADRVPSRAVMGVCCRSRAANCGARCCESNQFRAGR